MSKTILVIDDEKDLVQILKDILKDEGYDVETAYDGEEGFEKIKHLRPKVIILDMNMPKMNGMEIYHKLYSPIKKQTMFPVIALTARSDLKELFLGLNVDAFITKPFEYDTLIDNVNAIFEKRYASDTDKKAKKAVSKLANRVLIVDEHAATLGRLTTLFQNYGYDVLFEDTALKAIETVLAKRVDCILINLALPDLPGELLIYKLRQMPKTMDTPVVLYSETGDGAEVTEQILQKTGIQVPFLSRDPAGLFNECHRILKKLRS